MEDERGHGSAQVTGQAGRQGGNIETALNVTPTCGGHDALLAFAAELGQQTALPRACETYANQIIFRARRWWSLAAKCSKTLPEREREKYGDKL